ncbi:MAG: exonuclease SbcCD subunit D [Chloroflexota bacterium]
MKILHFADLHLGVESYGRIDPATGLSSRISDFLSVFDQVVDYALESKVDLVIFCGDAYKSREPGQTHQREFARRIRHLSDAGVPVLLLVGNHDLPNTVGRATSTEIFGTLAVHNVSVAGRPDLYRISTPDGVVQVVTLPWPRRSSLLAGEQTRGLSFEEINRKLEQALTETISNLAERLDPAIPSILAAHVWVANARLGSENRMTIGREHTLLLSDVANPAFDYVALGHIHRHRMLSTNPPVAYSGSLERLDFGEEDDEKGFYVVDIDYVKETGKKQVRFDFHPVRCRRFVTINIEVGSDDIDPTATVLQGIIGQQEEVKDAVVRVEIGLPAAYSRLRENEIRESLKEASYYTIARNVRREIRERPMGGVASETTPLDALREYLEAKKTSPERMKVLLEHGKKLIELHESKKR